MSNYKINVGTNSYTPWENYSRGSLEYSCVELGMSSQNLDQYSNEELFKKLISLGYAKSVMEEEE